MTDADYMLECVTRETTGTEKLNELVRNRNLKRRLHYLDWIWFIGKTTAKAIVQESRISLLGSVIDVGVFRRNVPVSSIEASTMCEELNRCSIDVAIREAELRVYLIRSIDGVLGGPFSKQFLSQC
jgi:hypothetical protein